MSIDQIKKLMQIEKECIKRGPYCDRNCADCDLVQKDTDLIEAYSFVIDLLEDIVSEPLFSPKEVLNILLERGQNDSRFSWGETIKYTPADIYLMLVDEQKKFQSKNGR